MKAWTLSFFAMHAIAKCSDTARVLNESELKAVSGGQTNADECQSDSSHTGLGEPGLPTPYPTGW